MLGLPIGQHITFKAKDSEGKDFFRPYTPTTDDDTAGHVDFVIKVYPDGKMSQHLDKMKVGQTMLFKGPKGRYTYETGSLDAIGDPVDTVAGHTQSHGVMQLLIVSYHEQTKHHVDNMCVAVTGMLAGGTGVTPMYQVANAILKNPTDKTKITLLFANVSADDILIEEELTNLQAQSPQFQVFICILCVPHFVLPRHLHTNCTTSKADLSVCC